MMAGASAGPEYIYMYAYPSLLKVSTEDASIAAYVDFYNDVNVGNSQNPKHLIFGDDGKLYVVSTGYVHRFNPDTMAQEERSPARTMNDIEGITYIDGDLYSFHRPGTGSTAEWKIDASNLAGGFTTQTTGVSGYRGYRHMVSYNGSGRRCYASRKYTYGINGFDFAPTGTDVEVSYNNIQGIISMHYYDGWWVGPWYASKTYSVQDGTTSPLNSSTAMGGEQFYGYRMSNDGLLVQAYPFTVRAATIGSSGLSNSLNNEIAINYTANNSSYNPNNKNLTGALPSKNEYRVVFLTFEGETHNGNNCVRIAKCDLNTNAVTAIGLIDPNADIGTSHYIGNQARVFTSTVTKAEMEWDAP